MKLQRELAFRPVLSMIVATILLALVFGREVHAGQPIGVGNNPNQEILDRLNAIEAKVDALTGEQVTATFCISQGRGLGLGADWIITADTEWEGGLGWAEVFSGEGTVEVKFPAGIIPSESAIKIDGNHGKNFDICIDLPLELGIEDTALVAELASDINDRAEDYPNRGKFQRRVARLIEYAQWRIPGLQTPPQQPFDSTQAYALSTSEGDENEFDSIDNAIDRLMASGLSQDGTAFSAFRNPDVRQISDAFGQLPVDIVSMVEDPEQLLDALSHAVLQSGIDDMECETFGMDSGIRGRKPGIDQICNRLEELPDYSEVEEILSGEVIGQLFEALDTLTITSGSQGGNVSQNARSRFCSSRVGQLRRFDSFCGR